MAPDRLRFDFSHYQAVTAVELTEIERLVNAEIRANAPAEIETMPFDRAVATGAMALFGEKYEHDVRVLRVGEFSMELCGGTHVKRAGDIGFFKIVSEAGIAAGIRRIEALTGEAAVRWAESSDDLIKELAALVRGNRDDVHEKVEQLLERSRKLDKEIQQLKGQLASGQGGDLASGAREINGVKVVATRVDGADARALRDAVDQLKSKLKSAVIVLGSVEGADKVLLVAGVTQDQTDRIKAGDLVGSVAQQVGGRGGGRPDMAQAGGSNPAALDAALASVESWVREKLRRVRGFRASHRAEVRRHLGRVARSHQARGGPRACHPAQRHSHRGRRFCDGRPARTGSSIWRRGSAPSPMAREMDVLLATGEQVSIALLCMALHSMRLHRALLHRRAGSRRSPSDVHTRARIIDVERPAAARRSRAGRRAGRCGISGSR